MPTPTRPLTGAAIESSWGQEVHDAAFAPAGGRWRSTSGAIGTLTAIGLTALTDPGGWLASPGATLLTVPADGDGIYLANVISLPSTGEANVLWRLELKVNGVNAGGYAIYSTSASTAQYFVVPLVLVLAAGNTLALNIGGPSAPATGRLDIPSFTLTRLGRAWGVA